MKKYKRPTQLQLWARERFTFKGCVARSIGMLDFMSNMKYLSITEKNWIAEARYNLDQIRVNWSDLQYGSRRKVSKNESAKT